MRPTGFALCLHAEPVLRNLPKSVCLRDKAGRCCTAAKRKVSLGCPQLLLVLINCRANAVPTWQQWQEELSKMLLLFFSILAGMNCIALMFCALDSWWMLPLSLTLGAGNCPFHGMVQSHQNQSVVLCTHSPQSH